MPALQRREKAIWTKTASKRVCDVRGGGDPTWACGACGDGYHVRPGNEVAPTHSNRQENKPMQFEQPCPKRKGESNNRYNAYMWATSET
jgi:hypothetical protein